MANKSGLDRGKDFIELYQGANIMEAFRKMGSVSDYPLTTILIFCTGK